MAGTHCLGSTNHNWCHDPCQAGTVAQGIRIEAVRSFLNAYGGQEQITTITFDGFPTESIERMALTVTGDSGCVLACKQFTIPRYLEGKPDEEIWEYVKTCINNSFSLQSLGVEPFIFDDNLFAVTIVGPIGQTQNYTFTTYGTSTWSATALVDQTALPVGEVIPFGHVVHQLAEKDSWRCVKTPALAYPDEVFLGISTSCGGRTVTEGRNAPGYEANTKSNGYCPHEYVDVLEEGAIKVKIDLYDPTVTVPLKHQQPIYNLTDPDYKPGAIGAVAIGGAMPVGWTAFPVEAKFLTCETPCAVIYIDHGHKPV
jgi:hypothetical protein